MTPLEAATEEMEAALAQLLIEVIFLVPPGTNLGPESAFGKALIRYRNALVVGAKL